VWLSDGKVRAKSAKRLKSQGNGTWVRVVLTEGKNREIRRMLAKLGHKVMRLKRIAIGPVKLDKLPKGKARRVSEEELKALRAFVAKAQEKIAAARLRAKESGDRKNASENPPTGRSDS
jgi:23S rRNA pseudouridine2605 synthase